MATEIKVPALGESIVEATVAKWHKSVGEGVQVDETLVELETEKVAVEVNAPVGGVLSAIAAAEGDDVEVGAVLGTIAEGAAAAAPAPASAPAPQPAAEPEPTAAMPLSPAVRKLIEESGVDPATVPASGKKGQLTKGDVLAFLEKREEEAPTPAPVPPPPPASPPPPRPTGEREERVRMSRLRRRVAERLKEAQNTAAMLTTFNEADMSAVMAARARYRDVFEKRHGVRLGFMSFFVKASIVALREVPAVNGFIDGDDIVFRNHYDVGVAVGSDRGLVVPVIRDADAMSFADIENAVVDFGRRARDGKLALEELQGGTFTVSNGGVYGSLLSTPIINPPQSGILGMHKIQQRPVVMEDGSIVARPMMYLAFSYDHRLVDGREAVTFLVRIKECIEDPQRIMLDM